MQFGLERFERDVPRRKDLDFAIEETDRQRELRGVDLDAARALGVKLYRRAIDREYFTVLSATTMNDASRSTSTVSVLSPVCS